MSGRSGVRPRGVLECAGFRATPQDVGGAVSPNPPFIRGLPAILVAPSIASHSIISVDGTGPPEQGYDGVVAYTSAHIKPVESGLVVRSPHSCRGNPHTIAEVRRTLRLQVGSPTTGGALDDAAVPTSSAR
jgi:hypothetical protein